MNRNKLAIFSLLLILIFFIIGVCLPDSKGYVLTPSEYTITNVYSYRTRRSRRYQINITYKKDGKEYKSHCYSNIDENEFNIIKNYFDNKGEEATKNYLGNIKVSGSSDFKILNEDIND